MKIEYLADHNEFIPELARWSFHEWSHYHPERRYEDVVHLMHMRAQHDTIPLCLIALEQEQPVGMIALKEHDLETRRDLTPWLAGLYVKQDYRRRGIGSALVVALEQKAADMGIEKLYLYTPSAEKFYLKYQWSVLQHAEQAGLPVTVMYKQITASARDR